MSRFPFIVCIALWAASAASSAAPVPDTLAQRVQACMGCHGKEGRAGPDGYYPRIAGKPAGYLFNQLQNFRDGRRHYPLMTGLLETMTDAYLREIAEHFASLDLPYAPQPPTTASPEVLARGRQLVNDGDATKQIPACVQCHGAALMGVAPAVPGLLGLPRDYLNGQLGAWQTGNRRAHAPDCMAQIAKRLTPDDVGAASAWLSLQPVPEPHRPATGWPAPLPMPCGGVPASVSGATK
jgi:cytochrome c553